MGYGHTFVIQYAFSSSTVSNDTCKQDMCITVQEAGNCRHTMLIPVSTKVVLFAVGKCIDEEQFIRKLQPHDLQPFMPCCLLRGSMLAIQMPSLQLKALT